MRDEFLPQRQRRVSNFINLCLLTSPRLPLLASPCPRPIIFRGEFHMNLTEKYLSLTQKHPVFCKQILPVAFIALVLVLGLVVTMAIRTLFLLAEGNLTSTRIDEPTVVVETAFMAFQVGDSDTINGLMSQQGQTNSALNCLHQNYPAQAGTLETSQTELVQTSDHTATVRLRTVWSERGERCQDYQLDKTDAGWQITYFSPPRKCPTTS